jgi:hypothetical protein
MLTHLSEQITIIRNETDLEDPKSTIEDKSPRPDPSYQRVGPAGLVGPHVSLRFVLQFPTAF